MINNIYYLLMVLYFLCPWLLVGIIRPDNLLLTRAFTITFTKPIVFLVDLYTALFYSALFIWFGSFPIT